MSDDKNELADHNHSPYRPCEDFDVTNKQRPRRQTFAEIVAVVDSTSSVLSEDVVIKPGVFNGSTMYDPEGRELVPTDGRALEPAGVQLAVLAGARLVWDACRCGGGIATTWSGLTELLFAKKLNVLCLDSAKATQ